MVRDEIELFMWGYQGHFRTLAESAVDRALLEIGIQTDSEVYLVGVLREGATGHAICIEPEDGPFAPLDFSGARQRAQELYAADPERLIRHSDPGVDADRHAALVDLAWASAIREVMERKLGLQFFVAPSAEVANYHVYTAIGLSPDAVSLAPSLHSGNVDRIRVMRSLLEGVLRELTASLRESLYLPDPGKGLGVAVDAEVAARTAGELLAVGACYRAFGRGMPHNFFDAMNAVATTSYEKRAGLGRIILAAPSDPSVDKVLVLKQPVPMKETRTIRKLLEISRRDGAALLSTGESAYGLGVVTDAYEPSTESVFEVVVSGPGTWELQHAGTSLMAVAFGTPRLPLARLSKDAFDDTANRVFANSGGCDAPRLWDLAQAAADAEHGTMLVVSAEADAEALRLAGQALVVSAADLDPGLVRQITSIDGAVLVDPNGKLAAIGVILDGAASPEGDRARGARLNSAIRYLATTKTPTVIVLVSEDGMLDLLPRLRPRVRRSEVVAAMDDLRRAADLEPVNPREFYRAFDRVKRLAFYLSQDQCDGVNGMVEEHWRRRKVAGATIWPVEQELKPDPLLSDDHFLPE